MKKIAFIFFLSSCLTSFSFAQPAGYKIAESEISSKLPVISNAGENTFKVNISRKFSGKNEERLLRIAEAVYPTAELKAEKCANPAVGKPSEVNWACGSFDDVLIPFSITKGAIAYYLKLTDDFRTGGGKMKTSMLDYSAEIKFQPTYETGGKKFANIYVVSMRLGWTQVCGELCALSFSKNRIVILDKKGKLLFVDGDGETPVLVS